jgi:hypothetical protein
MAYLRFFFGNAKNARLGELNGDQKRSWLLFMGETYLPRLPEC